VIDSDRDITFQHNFHLGVPEEVVRPADDMNMAYHVQELTEDLIGNIMLKARDLGYSDNLVYMGGVALNCLANRILGEYFDRIWIMPNPGDAGSSLGAAALVYGGRLAWTDSYLGHDIPGSYPVKDIISELTTNKIVGVANGRAEFGPRALGNRSLLADPRGPEIKDKVNEIKRRQKFRPFAPVILEELVHDYFDMPVNWDSSPYMQTVATCKYPGDYPAIVHVDGTSRVQTVPKDGSGIRELLEQWYVWTGCPMLLNTSLNIRGEPMVNDRADADRFEQLYGVRVLS
jgi:carbamoyltransferase